MDGHAPFHWPSHRHPKHIAVATPHHAPSGFFPPSVTGEHPLRLVQLEASPSRDDGGGEWVRCRASTCVRVCVQEQEGVMTVVVSRESPQVPLLVVENW